MEDNNKNKTIDTSKLTIGSSFTYKELCELLNEPYKTSNSKKAQLDDWSRYFKYEKSGRSYTILDIYDEPLEKEDKYPSNAIYIKYIRTILLSILANTDGNRIRIDQKSLYKMFGMINDNYSKIQKLSLDHKVEKLKEIHEWMTAYEINDFYDRCGTKMSKIVKSSLDSLKNRALITYSEEYEYYVYEHEDLYDPRSRKVYRSYIADADETEYILKVKRETLEKYGCDNEGQIRFRKKSRAYYDEINNRLKNEMNWRGYKKVYTITYCQETSIKALERDKLELEKCGLNSAIIDFLDEQALRNYEKTEKIDKDSGQFRYPDSYVGLQQVLSYELLNIDKNRPKPYLLVEKERQEKQLDEMKELWINEQEMKDYEIDEIFGIYYGENE